jgi:hypothetical protein
MDQARMAILSGCRGEGHWLPLNLVSQPQPQPHARVGRVMKALSYLFV